MRIFFSLLAFLVLCSVTETFAMLEEDGVETALKKAHVHKIKEGLYTGLHKDQLYFVLEKIYEKNIEWWRHFVKTQKKEILDTLPSSHPLYKSYDPMCSFERSLDLYEEPIKKYGSQLWVAYAYQTRPEGFIVDVGGVHNIEMVFSVLTREDAPFMTHMGIFRTLCYDKCSHPARYKYQPWTPPKENYPFHKNISIPLHSFAAKVVCALMPNKKFMITSPVKTMQEIFERALSPEYYVVGDNTRERHLQQGIAETLDKIQNLQNHEEETSKDKLKKEELENELSEYQLKLAEWQSDLKTRGLVSFLKKEDNGTNTVFRLLDKDKKVLLALSDEEYKTHYGWFSRHRDLGIFALYPHVCIDTKALADISPLQ